MAYSYPLCPFPLESGLPCSSPGKEGQDLADPQPLDPGVLLAWVWLFIFLCVPADSCSSPLPVRAAGLVWRFLKQ